MRGTSQLKSGADDPGVTSGMLLASTGSGSARAWRRKCVIGIGRLLFTRPDVLYPPDPRSKA